MRPPESLISQPIRSLQTMLRTIAEDTKMIPTVVPDGIYGPTTMAAVTEFQRQENLPLTGITDLATWERIVERYDAAIIRRGPAEPIEVIWDPGQEYTIGDEGANIYLMQTLLIWLSKDNNDIQEIGHTGQFDPDTQQALIAFQSLAGIPPTGVLDRNTWKHLSRHFTLNSHHNGNRNVINLEA